MNIFSKWRKQAAGSSAQSHFECEICKKKLPIKYRHSDTVCVSCSEKQLRPKAEVPRRPTKQETVPSRKPTDKHEETPIFVGKYGDQVICIRHKVLYCNEKQITLEEAREIEERYYRNNAYTDVTEGDVDPGVAYPRQGFTQTAAGWWLYTREYTVDRYRESINTRSDYVIPGFVVDPYWGYFRMWYDAETCTARLSYEINYVDSGTGGRSGIITHKLFIDLNVADLISGKALSNRMRALFIDAQPYKIYTVDQLQAQTREYWEGLNSNTPFNKAREDLYLRMCDTAPQPASVDTVPHEDVLLRLIDDRPGEITVSLRRYEDETVSVMGWVRGYSVSKNTEYKLGRYFSYSTLDDLIEFLTLQYRADFSHVKNIKNIQKSFKQIRARKGDCLLGESHHGETAVQYITLCQDEQGDYIEETVRNHAYAETVISTRRMEDGYFRHHTLEQFVTFLKQLYPVYEIDRYVPSFQQARPFLPPQPTFKVRKGPIPFEEYLAIRSASKACTISQETVILGIVAVDVSRHADEISLIGGRLINLMLDASDGTPLVGEHYVQSTVMEGFEISYTQLLELLSYSWKGYEYRNLTRDNWQEYTILRDGDLIPIYASKNGNGPYHEETRLGIRAEKDGYTLIYEEISPMGGSQFDHTSLPFGYFLDRSREDVENMLRQCATYIKPDDIRLSEGEYKLLIRTDRYRVKQNR